MQRIVQVPNMGNPQELVDFAVQVEQAGFDGFFVWDHINLLLPGHRLEVHDPWLLLTAVAAATEHIRIGTAVTPISRRRPQKLAKEIVTLDHLSRGRFTLGVGLGEPSEHEFAPFGETVDQRTRAAMTDESLALLDQLLRGEPVDHGGQHYDLHAHLEPGAVQQPRPPVWIAATPPYRKGLERAAQWDGLFCNLRVKQDYSLLTPTELRGWVGDLLGRGGFEVVAMPPSLRPVLRKRRSAATARPCTSSTESGPGLLRTTATDRPCRETSDLGAHARAEVRTLASIEASGPSRNSPKSEAHRRADRADVNRPLSHAYICFGIVTMVRLEVGAPRRPHNRDSEHYERAAPYRPPSRFCRLGRKAPSAKNGTSERP